MIYELGNFTLKDQCRLVKVLLQLLNMTPGTQKFQVQAIGTLGLSQSLVSISGGRLFKYNLWTGAMSANYSISPLTSATYIMNGYALGIRTLATPAFQTTA